MGRDGEDEGEGNGGRRLEKEEEGMEGKRKGEVMNEGRTRRRDELGRLQEVPSPW